MRRYLNFEGKGGKNLTSSATRNRVPENALIFCMNASESDRKYVLAYYDALPGFREELVLI